MAEPETTDPLTTDAAQPRRRATLWRIPDLSDVELQREARVLYTVLRPMLVVLLVACVTFLIPGLIQHPTAGIIVVAGEAALLFIALVFASRGRVDVASGLTIVSFLIAALVAVGLFGGTQGAVATTLLPPVVLAGALRGWRAVLWSSGVVAVGCATLGWLEGMGQVPVILPNVSVNGSVVVFVINGLLLVVYTGLLVGRLREAQAQAEATAEEARASAERLATLLRELPDGVVLLDKDGTILECNPAVERMTGFSAEELLGKKLLDSPVIDDDKTHSAVAASFARVLEGRRDLIDVAMRRKDGTPWVVQAHASVVEPVKQALRVQVSLRDVTALREAERLRRSVENRAQEAERLETVGRLAGGVAHDFRNLLTAVIGNAELLDTEGALNPNQRDQVQQLLEAADRANALTRQLLTFSGRQEQKPVLLNPSVVVAGLETLLHRLLRDDISLHLSTPDETLTIRADSTQLEQVVMNLVANARDAMPKGGRLTVDVSETNLDADSAALQPGARAGPYVVLAVTDTGSGMSPETVERVFEPFFSTKSEGEGTGLGLATVHGIVTRHKGHLTVYSEPGQGACFKAYFPRVNEALVTMAEEEAPPEPPARAVRETVLVADDEPRVLNVAARVLTKSGYLVLTAADGDEATTIAESEPTVHALVTDMVMPGPSGRELAARVRERHPEAVVVYMSGYTEDSVAKGSDLGPGERFVAKPFRVQTLRDALAGLLEALPTAPQDP